MPSRVAAVRRLPLATLAVALLTTGPAQAEPSAADKAAAERLFDAARRLSTAGNHAEACPKYVESNRFDPAVGTLMYLADCYEKTDKPASAWATWLEAAAAARRGGQKERERVAKERAVLAEKQVPNLTVEVPPAARIPGLVVTKNGEVMSAALFGAALPTDPGTFVIQATAPGRQPWTLSAEVVRGATKVVSVPELGPASAAPPPASAPAAPPASAAPAAPAAPTQAPASFESSPGPSRRTAGLVVGGVGALGLAVGSFFGLRAILKNNDSDPHCRTATLCDHDGLGLRNEARSAGNLSTAFFALGAVGVGVGAALYLTAPRHESAALRVTPAGTRGGLLSLSGRF